MRGFAVISMPFGRKGAALGAIVAAIVVLAVMPPSPVSSPGIHGPSGTTSESATEGWSAAHDSSAVASQFAGSARPAATPALTAPGMDSSAISLSWTDANGGTFTNYTVEEASPASSWRLSAIQTITTETTTATVVAGLAPGADYDWQMVEYYQTCTILLFCTTNSVSSNLLNLTQPGVAFLNATSVTSTSVTLNWTNNATYGGSIGFVSYELYEDENSMGATLYQTYTNVADRSQMVTVASGQSYSFYVDTVDCTAGCGTGSPSTVTGQSNVVTAGPPTTLTVTVFAQRTTIDLGQSDLFTCTPVGGEYPFDYQWQFGASASFVPGNATEAALLGSPVLTTVTCEVTDHEPVTQKGAADVQVNPTLVVGASTNRTAVDVGEAAGFTCYATGGTPPYALDWSFGDGTTSATGNTSHAFGTAADYAPSCDVSDSTGASLAPAFPLVVSPTLSAAAKASSTSAAPDTSLTFSASPINGSGTYSHYAWTFPGGGTASGRSVSYAFLQTGTEVAQLVVTDSNGATAKSSVSVTVSYVTATVSAPSGPSHTGSALSFAATGAGGAGGPYNYTWSFGDGSTAYGASVQHSYSATGTMRPTLVVTDRLGASNTTHLAALALSTPPGPLTGDSSWIILGIGIAIAAVVGFLVLGRRRAAEASELAAGSAYVPPTDPKKTIQGRKVCAACGATNLPIRTTCGRCGKPLPRTSA
jgi:hypothetical protein